MTDPAALRSVLYLPADRARAVEKARTLPADALIFDLEDAVAPEAKDEARALLVKAMGEGGFGKRYRIARCNALGGPWGEADLAALAGASIDALLVPKIDDAAALRAAVTAMARHGFDKDVRLWAMIETPAAVIALREICAAAAQSPLRGLVLGLNDLSKDSGIAQRPGRAAFVPVLTGCVLAARANGLHVIDGVCNALDDEDRLVAECEQARDFGFDGKSLIHPRQVEAANRAFSPSQDEVAEAQAIVAAFADPANARRGALRVNGAMVERLHLEQARRVLARAEG